LMMNIYKRFLLSQPKRIGAISVPVVAALCIMLVQFFLHHWALTELVLFVPVLLIIEQVSRSPRTVGYLVARDTAISLLGGFLVLAAAIILAVMSSSVRGEGDSRVQIVYILLGLIIGLSLRHAIGRLVRLALVARDRLGQNCSLLVVWTLAIVLFPQPIHGLARPYYIAGVGVGIILHKSVRLRLSLRVSAYRRLLEVIDAFPPNAQVTQREVRALELLARGRQYPSMKFRALRRFLDEARSESSFSKRLALISASVHRLEGDYDRAVAESQVASNPPQDLVDTHLLLLRALSIEEQGLEPEVDSLILTIRKSVTGRACPLTASVRARREAEQVLRDFRTASPSRYPLIHSIRALELRRQALTERFRAPDDSIELFLKKFLGVGVPLTPSFVLDILGYCTLSAGNIEEARVLLHRWIGLDPSYSYSYLHLGDVFLFRHSLGVGDQRPHAENIWHAKACYFAALHVERSAGSRVKKLARSRLELADSIAAGEGA
jgi:tetratricopeptide (TPR) repeat protein